MLGSLRKVWPWKAAGNISNANVMPEFSSSLLLPVILAVAGFLLVLAIEYIARRIEMKNGEKL